MAVSSNTLMNPAVTRELKQSIDEAREDTTPHVGVVGDEIMVIGDANKTETQKHDYKVTVIWPKEKAEQYGIRKEDIIKDNGRVVAFETEFKDVQIVPRNRFKVTSAMADILPFFTNPKNDGSMEERSMEEITALCVEMSETVVDSLYLLVGAVLDVKKDVYSNFEWNSVLELVNKILHDFPDVVNEVDF